MNGWSRIGVVFRKELTDALRDRRTLVAMVVAPILLYPLLMVIVVQALQFQRTKLERQHYRIGVPDEAHAAWLRSLTAIDEAAASQPATASAPDETPRRRRAAFDARVSPEQFEIVVARGHPRRVMEQRRLHAYLRVTPPPVAGESDPPNRLVRLNFDATEVASDVARSALTELLARQGDRIVNERLGRRGVPIDQLAPYQIEARSTASSQKLGGALLGQIMPFLLVIMTITGAIYPAIDLTAGERERGTLETLMAAPVPVMQLVAGKFLVIVVITLVITTLNLLSIGATVQFGGLAQALAASTGGGVSTIPLRVLPIVMIAMLPLAVLFSAVMLATCSFARTFKEAQNYMMPVMIAVMVPAMIVTYIPTLEITPALAVTPVANVVALVRELFVGKGTPATIALVMGSTCLYAAAAVLAAARLFGQEAVLFTDVGSYHALLNRRYFRPRAHPSAAVALLLLAVLFPVQFYWQSALIKPDSSPAAVRLAIAASQVLFFALPAIGLTWWLRLNPRETLSLRAPAPIAALGALLIAAGIAPVAVQLSRWQFRLFPSLAGDAALGDLERLLLGDNATMALVFALAVLPGVSEELLFRGVLMAGLRSHLRPVALCLTVGLIFGLYHVIAAKLLTTAILGALLTFVCWRGRSIFLSMLVHVTSNGLLLLAARSESLAGLLGDDAHPAPGWVAPTAWTCVLAGVAILALSPPVPKSAGIYTADAADIER